MTIEERLLRLVQIDTMEASARRRQAEHEHPALHLHPRQEEAQPPEVDLALGARRVELRDLHLGQHRRLTTASLGNVTAHRRLTHDCVMLVDETLPDATRGVTLLPGRLPIRLQPFVDRRLPRLHHR